MPRRARSSARTRRSPPSPPGMHVALTQAGERADHVPVAKRAIRGPVPGALAGAIREAPLGRVGQRLHKRNLGHRRVAADQPDRVLAEQQASLEREERNGAFFMPSSSMSELAARWPPTSTARRRYVKPSHCPIRAPRCILRCAGNSSRVPP